MVVRNYLDSISALSIFPDILANQSIVSIIIVFVIFLIFSFGLPIVLSYLLKEAKGKAEQCFTILYYLVVCFISIILIFFNINLTSQPCFLVIFSCLYLVSLVIPFSYFYNTGNKDQMFNIQVVLCISSAFIFLFVAKLPNFTAKKINFYEYSKEANWYLLDKRFIENKIFRLNKGKGLYIDEESFHALKNKFRKWDYCDNRKYNLCFLESSQYKYSNALYGYFAWNLGETKVFCPAYIPVDEIKLNMKGKQHPCLFIKGEYLTPLPSRL
ncbi:MULTISPECIES: hypothetical protein [Pasteurellaceae]|nr:hypothetical protein [Pasteurella atlantica]MBR0573983.1 hypothetical protein [Pasteurella atlantica]MDP8039946.1 hypothetical protein [Pasteurella atlantica]MDP8042022.1 hypothetical protein [Pasteurella atlantica]MDP8044207.1 hypothetical protein [Pasteurella atlantica]MDP8046228.1 hypothetical protein [Pasteurella atlantica]